MVQPRLVSFNTNFNTSKFNVAKYVGLRTKSGQDKEQRRVSVTKMEGDPKTEDDHKYRDNLKNEEDSKDTPKRRQPKK